MAGPWRVKSETPSSSGGPPPVLPQLAQLALGTSSRRLPAALAAVSSSVRTVGEAPFSCHLPMDRSETPTRTSMNLTLTCPGAARAVGCTTTQCPSITPTRRHHVVCSCLPRLRHDGVHAPLRRSWPAGTHTHTPKLAITPGHLSARTLSDCPAGHGCPMPRGCEVRRTTHTRRGLLSRLHCHLESC